MDGQDNKRRIYNGKCPPGEKGDQKRKKMVAILRTLESSRREAPKNREEEESVIRSSSRINFRPFPMY